MLSNSGYIPIALWNFNNLLFPANIVQNTHSDNQNQANSNLNHSVFFCSGLFVGMMEFAGELSKPLGSVSTMSLRPCR
jgi:hypothetical protein